MWARTEERKEIKKNRKGEEIFRKDGANQPPLEEH